MNDIIEEKNVNNFLNLLSSRLKHKYSEEDIIIYKLDEIKNNFILLPKKIDIQTLDKICKKFYFDFDMEKSEDMKMGYTEEERSRIRVMMINIIKEFSACSSI